MTVSTLAPRARRKMVRPERPDRATAYALDVTAGRIVAGRLVRLACERHLSDLATGADRGLRWDAAESEKAISFFGLLQHYKGRDDLIVLDPWSCQIVGSAWGWKREDGRRRFRYVYCEVEQERQVDDGGRGRTPPRVL